MNKWGDKRGMRRPVMSAMSGGQVSRRQALMDVQIQASRLKGYAKSEGMTEADADRCVVSGILHYLAEEIEKTEDY